MSSRLLENGGYIGYQPELKTDKYKSSTNPIFVGGASVGAFGSGTATVTFSTGLTGGLGGSLQQGDVVIVGWVVAGDATDLVLSLTTAGYTTLYDIYQAGSTYSANLGVFYKVMGATPDTTVVAPSRGSAYQHSLNVQVWRNVNTSSPIATSTTAQGTNAANTNPPAITTVNKRSPIFVVGGASSGSGSNNFTAPTDLFNFLTSTANGATYDVTGGNGFTMSTSVGQTIDPTGPWVGPFNATGTWVAATVEISPVGTPQKVNSGIWDLSSTASPDYYNDFEEPLTGWTSVSAATLTASALKSYSGLWSVQTNLTVDTDGVYTTIPVTYDRNFTVEYWGFTRPLSVYMLNASGQGYGMRVLSGTFEPRVKGSFTTAGVIMGSAGSYSASSGWMRCKFVANSDNTFTLSIYDAAGVRLGTVTSPADTTYAGGFNTLLINGSGNSTTSYLDDLRIRKNG